MMRRFSVRDVVLLSALTLILLTIILAMYMVDRQWLKMTGMQQTMQEQAEDLRGLRLHMRNIERRIQAGGVAKGNAADETVAMAFQRAQQATRMAGYSQGDWLVMAFGMGLKTITPLVSTDAYSSEVQAYVLESLLTRDPDTLEWHGLLAKSWLVSKDGLRFTFQLRRDVKFSDGRPLTAADVAFTFNFIMNAAIAAPRDRAYYEKIASVTAKGDYEVVFRFKEPYFNSLSLAGSMSILAKHFYQPYLQQPERFNQSKGLLIGTGPYRLKDPKAWTPDQGLVELERNPRYWGPVQPSFDRVLWKVIENDSARLTTFRNGELDIYSARPLENKKLRKDKGLTQRSQQFEYMSPTAGYSYIGWNQERNGKPTRFADKRVRQAMTYLTDRQRIISEIFLGYAEVAVSPFSPRSKQHKASITPRSYDLQKARSLLKAAGYADRNGDGVLEDTQGKPFEFEVVYFQDSEDTKRLVLFLKDTYARAGVLLRPKPTEWSVMLDLVDKKNFDAITLGWTSGVEVDIYQMFHSSQRVAGGDNFVNYNNPRMDKLIDKARATVNEAKRMPLWHAAEEIFYEDQAYTFLVRRKSLLFLDKRLQNLKVTRLGLNLNQLPVEIYVPGMQQKYRN